MSKIAKQPILIVNDVSVTHSGDQIAVRGKRGQLSCKVHRFVSVQVVDKLVTVGINDSLVGKSTKRRADAWMHAGTARSLLQNMITGVSQGFTKVLLLQGVGYRAQMKGKDLVMNLGYSHDVIYPVPDDIMITVNSPTELSVNGIDRQRVGQVAANIRMFRPPEPYKGKGIHYQGVPIIRKEVKKKK